MERGLVLELELQRLIQENQNDYDAIVQESILESSAEIELKEQELALLRKSIEECRIKRDAHVHRVHSLGKLIQDRSDLLDAKNKQVDSIERQLSSYCRNVEAKEREYSALARSVEERSLELQATGEMLKSVQKQIAECERNLRLKDEECSWQLEMMNQLISEREEVHKKMQRAIEACGVDLRAKESRLCVVEGLIREREQELQAKDVELHRDREWKEEELRELSVKIADCDKELRVREEVLNSMQRLIDGEGKEVEFKRTNLLKSIQVKNNQLVREHESMREKSAELEKREKNLEEGVRDLESKKKQLEGQVKEFESKEKQYGGQGKELKAKEREFDERVKKFESIERQFEAIVEEFESKEMQFEGRVKEIELREKQFEGQVKEFETKQKQYDEQVQELKAKEKQFEVREKELESKEKVFEGQAKGHELKESQFRLAMKQLESEEKQFEGRVKDLHSKQCQLGRQQKELELKEKQYESLIKSFEEGQVLKEKSNILLHRVKAELQDFTDADSVNNCKNLQLLFNLVKNYDLVCSKVSDALQTSADPSMVVLVTTKGFCTPQLRQELAECDANISRRIRNLLIDELKKSSPVISSHVKQEAIKFASDWKANVAVADTDCLEVLDFLKFVSTYEIGSSLNEHELQRFLDIISQHCQAPEALGNIEKLPDNQICPTTADGRNLQLLSDEPELIGNDILACLQTSSNPATLVLDIIESSIVPRIRNGNEGVIIDGSHIILLDQLMRISPSPHIELHIRDAAKKLAIALKEKLNPSDENSSVVLGFLLLLAIYGLVSFFNEDEVLKLFELVAQHKLAVELFRTLGFAHKISDVVENLIQKKQYVEAVRYICAYKLTDKIDPVGLLQLQVARTSRLFKKGRKKPIAKKLWGNDIEIRMLEDVLQCISDNNLESQDLVIDVQRRIRAKKQVKEKLIAQERQKEELVRLVSKLSSTLEKHQPEEKKCPNEGFPENQVQQPEEKISADIAVTESQVEVQQPKEKESANGAVTKNEVKVQQLDAKKPANGDVTMNQVKVQQPEEHTSTNETVTVNQVQVQQPQEKKRPIEAVPNNHQLHQSDHDDKRPRTAGTYSLPPRVFTSQYQHTFSPSGMPTPFGVPPNYYGINNPGGVGHSGANYFCHRNPYPPFR